MGATVKSVEVRSQHSELFERAEHAIARSLQAAESLADTMKRLEELIKSEGAAITRSRVAELNELVGNLTRKIESQPIIEQAKGILMARSHVSADEAFDILRRASMRSNRKLRDLAADVVAHSVRQPDKSEHA